MAALAKLRNLPCWVAPLMLGIVVPTLVAPAAIAGPLEGFGVGAGFRAGFNDDTSFAVGAKLPITQFKIQGNGLGLSVRPDLIFGSELEVRTAVTVDASALKLAPYGGGGLAYNTDNTGDLSPMLSAGLEYDLQPNAAVRLGGNYIFQDGDTDTEFLIMGMFNF